VWSNDEEEEEMYAIIYRQKLRRKLIAFWKELCRDCQENKKAKRCWGQLLEQLLYKKRKGE